MRGLIRIFSLAVFVFVAKPTLAMETYKAVKINCDVEAALKSSQLELSSKDIEEMIQPRECKDGEIDLFVFTKKELQKVLDDWNIEYTHFNSRDVEKALHYAGDGGYETGNLAELVALQKHKPQAITGASIFALGSWICRNMSSFHLIPSVRHGPEGHYLDLDINEEGKLPEERFLAIRQSK